MSRLFVLSRRDLLIAFGVTFAMYQTSRRKSRMSFRCLSMLERAPRILARNQEARATRSLPPRARVDFIRFRLPIDYVCEFGPVARAKCSCGS